MNADGGPTRRTFLSLAGGALAAGGTVEATDRVARQGVASDLRDRSGEASVVLRLDRAGLPDGAVASRERTVRRLKRHAGETQRQVRAALEAAPGVDVRRGFWLANALVATVDLEAVSLDEIAALDHVEGVHGADTLSARLPGRGGVGAENTARSGAQAGSDEGCGPSTADPFETCDASWPLELMNAPEVWERHGTRGEGARVCIVDTGADPDHPDIDVDGWVEFTPEGERVDTEPTEYGEATGHGTNAASAAVGGDASGMHIGVAPDAELYVASFGPDPPESFFVTGMAALEWAVENGCDVASMSFTMEGGWGYVIEPVENAVAAGTLPLTPVEYPAPFAYNATTPSMLTTAPLDTDLTPRQDANGGPIRPGRAFRGFDLPEAWPERTFVPDVSTPGTQLPLAVSGSRFPDRNWTTEGRGASFTNPYVAGIVALLRSIDGSLTPAEIRATIRETAFQPSGADDPVPNDQHGYGIPDALAAVTRHVDADREIAGVVTDTEGTPVGDATVTAASGPEATTDEDGSYALAVPSGTETVTADAVGYEPVERTVEAGAADADLAFETRVVPDAERVEPVPTQAAPGETITLAFDVAHADAALIEVAGEGRRVAPSAFDLAVNGSAVAVGEPVSLPADTRRLTVELTSHEAARGTVEVGVEVGNRAGELTTRAFALGPVHVHETPLRVGADEDIQRALDAAAPDTRVELADAAWEIEASAFEPTFPSSLLDVPFLGPELESARDDEAGLVVDRPLTLTAADGADPTISVTGVGSTGRTVGVRVGADYATVSDVAVEADGALAGVSVLDGTGVEVEGVSVSGAAHGVLGEITFGLLARANDLRTGESGVRLDWLAWNALVSENRIRDAARGVVLDGGLFIAESRLERNRFENVGTEVVTEGEGVDFERVARGEGTATPETGTETPDRQTVTPTETPDGRTATPTDRTGTPVGGTTDGATDAGSEATATDAAADTGGADGTDGAGGGTTATDPSGTPTGGDASAETDGGAGPGTSARTATSDSGPGFGLASGLAAVCGTAALLKRRLTERDGEH